MSSLSRDISVFHEHRIHLRFIQQSNPLRISCWAETFYSPSTINSSRLKAGKFPFSNWPFAVEMRNKSPWCIFRIDKYSAYICHITFHTPLLHFFSCIGWFHANYSTNNMIICMDYFDVMQPPMIISIYAHSPNFAFRSVNKSFNGCFARSFTLNNSMSLSLKNFFIVGLKILAIGLSVLS